MKAHVVVQPEADEQALVIDSWWRENRLAAPDLFANELTAALGLLADAPGVGRRYSAQGLPGLRRLMLPASRYHVYYVHDPEAGIVHVIAIWSAVRGKGPSLRRP
ncbi:type II toxin-antitoxin system RelE/ParE family toxin [Hyalangium minutum]|uniref:type II toxin-antitoxin system RelE/ParE family toxin n=1 Tax=Hyalangium minutum TaxID=394096 RepID=UPI00094B4EBD